MEIVLTFNKQKYQFVRINKKQWKLMEPASIELTQEFHQSRIIELPEGYRTDFRSGPYWIPDVLVPRIGMWYVVHDWLYQNQIGSKQAADCEQNYWMVSGGVGKLARILVNLAAKLFGSKYWRYYQLGGEFPYSRKKYKALISST